MATLPSVPVGDSAPRPAGTARRPARSVPTPDFIEPLLEQPVAVFGGGGSGQAVDTLLARLGAAGVVYDERPGVGAARTFGPEEAARHRLVVFSPGFPPGHAWLAAARSAECTCLGEMDFASLFWPGRIIAITGTNGKSTLTAFLAHALVAAGEDASQAGNIGFPFSRLILFRPDAGAASVAVCEVSSFQAETMLHFRADALLWTNFAEDHLERHPGLPAYFEAKWNLLGRVPAKAVFAGASVQRFAVAFGRSLPAGAAVASEGAGPDPRLEGTAFAAYPQRENFLLAQAWWRQDGRADAELYAAARTFKPERHRLARVGEHDGVAFWNDSKATNFHATEAALGTFPGRVQLIAGGRSKGGDAAGFVRRIAPRVGRVWLIGETRGELAALCAAAGVPYTVCATLEEAVRGAAGTAGPGGHVVLSPGFASFDMFRSYADRGDQFEQIVRNLRPPATFR